MGVQKKLRTGQTLSLGAVGDYSDVALAGVKQTGPDNVGRIRAKLVQPLGKGRGREAADAGEESSRILSEASLQELQHVLATKALQAVRAYWGTVAAVQQLKILMESEERLRIYSEQIATLIAREEIPASEISQARANLADARRTRANGEQALAAARQQLLLAIGVGGSHLTSAVTCRNDFPAALGQKALQNFNIEALILTAFNHRADYRAKELTESACRVFLAGVQRNLAPQVDLKLEGGYAGYRSGSGPSSFGEGFLDNVSGASVSMQLVAEWPFSNSEWRGRFMQAQAQLEQARWDKEKLDRQIRSDITVLLVPASDPTHGIPGDRQGTGAL